MKNGKKVMSIVLLGSGLLLAGPRIGLGGMCGMCDMDKGQGNSNTKSQKTQQAVQIYACPMHCDDRQPAPGKCPKCGMILTLEVPQKGLSEKAIDSNEPQDHKDMKM